MKTIEFKSIKDGDQLKVTTVFEHGTVIIAEGTAAWKSLESWVTRDRQMLVDMDLPRTASRTIELVKRPELPYKPGSLIRAVLEGRSPRHPEVLVRVEKVEAQDELVWLELSGTGQNFITEEEIVSWVALKLEPVQ